LKIILKHKCKPFPFNQSNSQPFAFAAGTYFLHGKKVGKEPFKGRNPLLGFLPLNIPTSQLNGASHLQLRLTAQVKLCLTRAAARS
jgi:hypothetical protein